MITIYLYDPQECELGFTFYLFGNKEFRIDYDFYEDHVEMQRYLKDSKCDILGINIERFLSYCREHINSSTFLIDEAIKLIGKATKWRVDNRDEYEKFVNLVFRGKHMFKDLIDAFGNNKEKEEALMMYEIIMQFVESELDDSK